ncbi:MAG: aminopeptidase P family N-terminal domain-containing protein, partial [Acidobacteriota bacterium]
MELLPRTEAEARLRRLQLWMAESSVDAVFILQNADLYYFAGTVQNGLLCLPASREPVFLVQKSAARACMESPW